MSLLVMEGKKVDLAICNILINTLSTRSNLMLLWDYIYINYSSNRQVFVLAELSYMTVFDFPSTQS